MTENKINKDAAIDREISGGQPDGKELEIINRFSRRPLDADEVYVFSVLLCDNDIDRDGERFAVESLFELEKLFVGKSGIFDHNPSGKNQTARIFECRVEAVEGKKTAVGDDYFRLKARAYMPRCKENEKLILDIDSGIVKEVSVGCAVDEIRCSVCGKELGSCGHIKGEEYSGKLCFGELLGVRDAYEWSFVAVPAQREAGVIKSFKREEKSMETILKNIEERREFTVRGKDCEKLAEYIDKLKKSAGDGVYYRDCLTSEVLRLSAAVQPGISRETMESVTKGMTVRQLNEFKNAFEKQLRESFSPKPQLYKSENKKAVSNGQFTI